MAVWLPVSAFAISPLKYQEQIWSQTAVVDSRPTEWRQKCDVKSSCTSLQCKCPGLGKTWGSLKLKRQAFGSLYIIRRQEFWPAVHISQWFILWGFVIYFPEFISFPMGPAGTHPILHWKKDWLCSHFILNLNVCTHNSQFLQHKVFP